MRRPPERQLRNQLIEFGRRCYERRLLVGMDGNLSVRLTEELILCTRTGCHKGMLTDDDLVLIDRRGNKVRGQGESTSETAMHLACYRERADVEAVIHAHPPMCVAFSLAGVSMARCVLPEVVLTLGTIPTLTYETTGTSALAERVAEAVRRFDAMVLDHHGAVCVGPSLLDAFCKLETMEHVAHIMKAARDLGGVRDLPPEESERLRRTGLLRYGGPPEAVAMVDQPGADLPEVCRSCSGCGNPSAEGLVPEAGFTVARVTHASPILARVDGSGR
ncbi:MAG: class II aldolase/adducin family protein [Deltaproteobacteria bacterium]|nr:class II aldolase/adducin family protein [Deltaproteobacteria bacterium]MBW2255473.1 class II aldolase/adducin family protein [Deltaproteobacteria bacterium]